MNWIPIEEFYKENLARGSLSRFLLLCNKNKKWIRFGEYYGITKTWYYSSSVTTKFSDSEMLGIEPDKPTHFMELMKFPDE